jgi:hypothetical protein
MLKRLALTIGFTALLGSPIFAQQPNAVSSPSTTPTSDAAMAQISPVKRALILPIIELTNSEGGDGPDNG